MMRGSRRHKTIWAFRAPDREIRASCSCGIFQDPVMHDAHPKKVRRAVPITIHPFCLGPQNEIIVCAHANP